MCTWVLIFFFNFAVSKHICNRIFVIHSLCMFEDSAEPSKPKDNTNHYTLTTLWTSNCKIHNICMFDDTCTLCVLACWYPCAHWGVWVHFKLFKTQIHFSLFFLSFFFMTSMHSYSLYRAVHEKLSDLNLLRAWWDIIFLYVSW